MCSLWPTYRMFNFGMLCAGETARLWNENRCERGGDEEYGATRAEQDVWTGESDL